jgi:hypothetical protein
MKPAISLTFTQISPDVFQRIMGLAVAAGAKVTAASNGLPHMLTFRGCTFQVDYDPQFEEINVLCLDKPFIVGEGLIRKVLTDLVDQGRNDVIDQT